MNSHNCVTVNVFDMYIYIKCSVVINTNLSISAEGPDLGSGELSQMLYLRIHMIYRKFQE